MKKRVLHLILAVLLCAGLFPCASLSAELLFADVSPDAWYYGDVKNAVASGLINGRTPETYCPDEFLTWAEAVKLAACLHQKEAEGEVTLENGDPWYRSYADYAKRNGIIRSECDWSANATRAGYMAMFARSVPEEALTSVNRVADGSIPDVPMTHPQAEGIYKLYRAGVVQGDEDHSCRPEDPIRRSEVAAVLTRMLDPGERKSFTLGTPGPDVPEALRILRNPVSCGLKTAEETVSFTVEIAGGRGPYIYKWVIERETGSSPTSGISGDTVSTYSVTFSKDSFAASKTVYVYCAVTDSEGRSVVSEKAAVTLGSDVLRIVQQPADCAVGGEGEASFAVEIAGGVGPYVYEWHEVLASRTVSVRRTSADSQNTLEIPDAEQILGQNGGEIAVYCVVTDSAGGRASTEQARLARNVFRASADPEAVTLPSSSSTFTLTARAEGGREPYSFQWFWGTAPDRLNDMSGWAEGYDTASVTARPDPRYGVQYMSCRVRDADGNEIFTPVIPISVDPAP